ncbi:MAG TPA: SGNH/GDSL hydrolase family protein [Marmoricola sp.]
MRPALLVVVLLVLAALGGCAGGGTADVHAGQGHPLSYVALGDSYTAAPFVPLTDVAQGCLRSDHDYPSLVARRLHVTDFRDVSCSGATTQDLVHRQRTVASRDVTVPPQLRALRPGTDLVTVGIGGNDFGISRMLLVSCPRGEPSCRPAAAAPQIRRAITALVPRLVTVVREVRRRAPHATVLLVGYPKVAPDHGTCPALPDLPQAALAVVNRLNLRLDQAIAAAAQRTGAGYVDVWSASRGHDICADVPWVNGIHGDTSRAAAMHPFGVEQRAVAQLVVRRVNRLRR